MTWTVKGKPNGRIAQAVPATAETKLESEVASRGSTLLYCKMPLYVHRLTGSTQPGMSAGDLVQM